MTWETVPNNRYSEDHRATLPPSDAQLSYLDSLSERLDEDCPEPSNMLEASEMIDEMKDACRERNR